MEMKKESVTGTALAILMVCGFAGSTYAIITGLTIHSTGNISMTRFYWNSELTNPVTVIAWDSLSPDTVTNRTFFIKNYSQKTVNLTMTTTNVNPSNFFNYARVSWNREGENIAGGQALEATVFLTVFANITESTISDFSFDFSFTEHWSA